MDKLKFKHTPAIDKVIYIAFFVLFAIFAVVYLYPLVWAIINSLKSMEEYSNDGLALPKNPLFYHYVQVFTSFRSTGIDGTTYGYFAMLLNSLWILVVNVTVNVCSSAMLAYALAKFRFPGSKVLYAVVIFANTIPIIGAGPAAYKLAMSLNLVNNPATIWLMWASGFDFAFIVLYGYFKGVSSSYSESAKMDGANNLVILFKIVLPQVIPCLVAIAITQAINVWNNYSVCMVYLRDYPNLAYGMYTFKADAFLEKDSTPIYFAAAVVSCIPVIVLYACTQELILTNMTTGGLKG
ncbi:MAG: carbohydrate ABC transporter permease [Clostridia bacterium]|nr:carbohydrate ABC transporter permease [Clostridia bacterium]